MLYWLLKYVLAGPLLRVLYPARVTGREHVPRSGPVVLVGNHLSVIDSIFMPLYVPARPVHFLAKSDYFTGRGLGGWAVRRFMMSTGQLPIDRSGGKRSEASLNTGLRALAEGRILALYPEGTRSPDGELHRGRTGVARTILAAKCPVVPAVVVGTEKMMPIGSRRLRRVPIEIHFGEPLDFSRFAGMEGDRFVLRSITDEIMLEIQRLSGQPYSDIYGSVLRSRMGAAAQTPVATGPSDGEIPAKPGAEPVAATGRLTTSTTAATTTIQENDS